MVQKQVHWQLLFRFLLSTGTIAVSPLPALAQRIPIADDTLRNEQTIVSPERVINNLPSNQIDGGARRGANLFHSFREFNIDNGRGVYFTNPAGVTNILTRVTGGNPSQILGALGILGGNANLFLLNPNGILFGSNAQLNVGGSFIASTANSLVFNNAFAFSATNPQAPPLLTVSVPLGLQYGSNPGAIQSQGASLQVQEGQTLALVGGTVDVNGGQLLAPGGRVELGGVSVAGTVGWNSDGSLSFPDLIARADVSLTNGAFVDVAAGGGGSIAIAARNLNLTEGSGLQAGIGEGLGSAQAQADDITIQAAENVTLQGESFIYNSAASGGVGNAGNVMINARSLSLTDGAQVASGTFGEGASGNLTIHATNSVQLTGFGSLLSSQTLGRGDAGKISIDTGNLIVRDGAQVLSVTYGEGAGGNLTVNAADSIQVIGESADGRLLSGLFANTLVNRGNAGNISIDTRNLIVRDGAQVASATRTEGAGGNLTVNSTDSVQLIGTSINGFPSGLFSQTLGRGDAGNISIDTRNLIILDGAQVISGTRREEGAGGDLTVNATDSVQLIGTSVDGQLSSGLFSLTENRGVAGDLSIETGNLIVRNGARVLSGTRGQGAGGSLTVNAANSIQVIGTSADAQFPSLLTAGTTASGNAGNVMLRTRQLMIEDGGQISSQQTTATATGNVGNINIEAQALSVKSNASITVEDRRTRVERPGTEPVGNINIQTGSFTIDRGIISADTASTNGGNIALDVQDLLLLRNGSLISTNAGTVGARGDGGNITFTGNFIVAVPNENSDITANAFTGRGGRVDITAQGIFGIQFRPQLTPLSDITASSERGAPGTVAINTPDVDPNRGLVQLPTDITDASRLIVQTCPTGNTTANQSNEFVVTGRGGLPPTPSEAVNRDAIQVDLVTTNAQEQQSVSPNQPDQTSSPRTTSPTQLTHAPLVEAQSWQIGADGRVVLVAAAPQNAIAPSPNRLAGCQRSP